MRKKTNQDIVDALWMGLFAGLGTVVVEGGLIVGLYLFDPHMRKTIAQHWELFLMAVPIVFIFGAGFAFRPKSGPVV